MRALRPTASRRAIPARWTGCRWGSDVHGGSALNSVPGSRAGSVSCIRVPVPGPVMIGGRWCAAPGWRSPLGWGLPCPGRGLCGVRGRHRRAPCAALRMEGVLIGVLSPTPGHGPEQITGPGGTRRARCADPARGVDAGPGRRHGSGSQRNRSGDGAAVSPDRCLGFNAIMDEHP